MLEYLSQTTLILWVAESEWGYPIVLTLHSIGMAFVVGIVAMFDLRVLGLSPQLSIQGFASFYRVAGLGFVLNLISGTLLFCANYSVFLTNTAFITKLSLLVLAALTTWGLVRDVNANRISLRSRAIASASLLLLFGAIVAGRIIAYTSVPE